MSELVKWLEGLAEAYDLRAHDIAENYDDIDDWRGKIDRAEERAKKLREAAAALSRAEEALTWIDAKYEDQNLGHQHFRVGAKLKASEALEAMRLSSAARDDSLAGQSGDRSSDD